MSENYSEEYIRSPLSRDASESARKRARLELSASKNWSLTEKRTDQEALQEMGVSIIEQDDQVTIQDLESNSLLKSGSKRKLNIENVNPNVNSASKYSPSKSPRTKFSPVAGPSHCDVKNATQELYQKLIYDEETPEQFATDGSRTRSPFVNKQSCTPGSREKYIVPFTPLEINENFIIKRSESICGVDSFNVLSDEMMLSIFKWLPKRTLVHCMMVCKRWHRVASDETFWQRLELGNRTIAKGAIGLILDRKPIVVRLAGSHIGKHVSPTPESTRIQFLDLSMCSIDIITLNSMLEKCAYLKKLSLEGVTVDDRSCELIGKCNKLEALNLTMSLGVTKDGVQSIMDGCQTLHSLNISWCNLCVDSLKCLTTQAPEKLLRLNVAGARIMTDEMVSTLVSRCERLVELDLSDCSRLGAPSVYAVLHLNRLEHLALSRCYLLPPHVLTKLSSMPTLQYLEVWGMLQEASLSALRSALPAIQINQFMHSAIARPTVGARRTSIWGLRTRD